MTGSELADAVLLYVDGSEGGRRPVDRTVAAIADALSLPAGSLSERVALLSALSELQSEGFVERTESVPEASTDTQAVCTLTERGREHARKRRQTLAEQSIEVDDGQQRIELSLGAVESATGVPMSRAIVERTEEGVLYLEDPIQGHLVDRTEEREQLTAVLDALEAGDGGVLRIVGEAGMGKTTLVDHFVEGATERAFAVCRATCQSDLTEPYRPIRDAIEGTVDPTDIALFEAGTHPISAEEDAGDFKAERRARFAAVAQPLAEAAADAPIVFVLDDSHWIDEPTLALVEELIDRLADLPVWFVFAHQPGPGPMPLDGVDDRDETVLDLSPFDRRAVRELVESLVGSRGIPDEFVAAIADRTGGTPLFVEESTKQLVEDGFVDPRHEHYPTDPAEIPIPDAVETAIAGWLDGLDHDGQQVLNVASVLGDECRIDTLQSICEIAADRVDDYVQLLAGARLWTRENGRIRFRTTVIRETVLGELSPDRYRRLNERAAATLSATPGGSPESVAAHYERAGKALCAIEHYRDAAASAREQYAHELAVEYAEAALDLARTETEAVDDDTVAGLLSSIGEAYALLGRHEAARKYYRYLDDRSDDPRRQQESYYHRAKTYQDCGEYDRACELAEEGLAVDGAPEEHPVVCRLLAVSGWSSRKQGNIEAALDIHDRQRAMAQRLGDDRLIGRALVSVGVTHLRLGDLDAAMELFERAVERFERAGEHRQLASARNEIAGVHRRRGDIEAAKAAFERSLSLMRSVGYQVGVAKLLTNLGLAHDNLGNVDQALAYYEEAIEASERLGDRQNVAVALCNTGNLYRHRGESTRAHQQFQRGLDINRDLQNDPHLIVFNLNLARVAFQRDDLDTAWEHTDRAVELAEDVGYPAFHANALSVLGRLHRASGELDRAIDVHQRAVDLATESDTLRREAFASVDLALDYAAFDRVEPAGEHADRAMAIADETDEQLVSVRARYARGVVCRVDERPEEAIEELQTARATAHELQSVLDEVRIGCELVRAAAVADETAVLRATVQKTRSRLDDAELVRLERQFDALDVAAQDSETPTGRQMRGE